MFSFRTCNFAFLLKRYEKCSRFYFISDCVVNNEKRPVVPPKYTDVSNFRMRRSENRKGQNRLNEQKNILQTEYLYGVSPCLAALKANRRRFYEIFTNPDAENIKTRPQFKEIVSLAQHRMVPVKHVSRKRLDNLCKNRPHQNVVMKVGHLGTIPLQNSDLSSGKDKNIYTTNERTPCWIFLEGIQDPMNLGGILRTAAYLGVGKVVISERYSCSLTPAVSKASAGTMEVLPVYCADTVQLLQSQREAGWRILGAVHPNHGSKKIPCDEFHLDKPCVLILGNEGMGLSKEATRLCTDFLTIPSKMYSPVADLDSLNVSVATGILLYSLLSVKDSV